MLLWLGGGDERKYEVLDFTDDCVRYEGLVAGPRILFACQVEENVWLVTQVFYIAFVYLEPPRVSIYPQRHNSLLKGGKMLFLFSATVALNADQS